jgi:hypothetical protein
MSVGTMLKISRLMPHSTHISVHLVHAVSCRWRTRETYFPTIPHKKQTGQPFNSNAHFQIGSADFSFHQTSILCHIYWENLLLPGIFTATSHLYTMWLTF